MKNILIKSGIIVNNDKTYHADILISDGKIIEIANSISKTDCVEFDATEKYIFPGGIDPHVHMELSTLNGKSSDDFESGSIAAIAGGTTTFIDFVTPERGESLITALNKRKESARKSYCNYALHMSIVDWHKGIENEIIQCIEKEGITSFKIYMAYQNTIGINDEILQKALAFISKQNAIIIAHCEIDNDIENLKKQFIAEGKTDAKYHPLSRPAETEAKAVKKIIDFASISNCPIYIVHTSTEAAITEIKKAQSAGKKVFSETCPQYLLLNESVYKGKNEEAVKYIISPPIRKSSDNKALWNAISNGSVTSIGTDHCPFNYKGQKELWKNNFTKVPNGAGGIEHRLELLYTFGVLTNTININQFVSLVSTNQADIFGIKNKGKIEIGYDADIVIWNDKIKRNISAKNHYQNCDTNIYENFTIKGEAETVIVNGKITFNNRKFTNNLPKEKYLSRKLNNSIS